MPPNKRMQLTKLRAAPVRQAEVPPCAPADQMDGGTASQLIRSVRRTTGAAMRTICSMLLVGALAACAERAPMALHGELRYPAPEHETCGLGPSPSELSVAVVDEMGAVIPGATVFVAAMANLSAGVTTYITNDAGLTRVTLPGAGDYALTVVLPGFMPAARALEIKAGCSGLTKVVLQVGPIVVER
jgi:hypothetical protein